MDTKIRTVDAAGEIKDAGGAGVGFSVVPAFTPSARKSGRAGGWDFVRPGSYPIKVRLDDGRLLEIVNGDPIYLERGFRSFKVVSATAEESWLATVMQAHGDRRDPAQRTRVCVPVRTTYTVPTTAPSDALIASGVAMAVPQGLKSWSFYCSIDPGVLHEVTSAVIVRTAGGEWKDTGTRITVNDTDPPVSQTVDNDVSGTHLYLRQVSGVGAVMAVAIDASVEVGG